MEPKPRKIKRGTRGIIRWGVRVILVVLLCYWLQTDLAQNAWQQLTDLSGMALFGMSALSLLLMFISSMRWAELIRGFGNPKQSVFLLLKLSLVGHFYNTFVPGAVGGDVLRAAISSHFYAKKNTSYLVVFMERLLGLSCLCLILGLGVFLQPELNSTLTNSLVLVGVLIVLGIIAFIFNWERLLGFAAPYIDTIEDKLRVGKALGLSLIGQSLTLFLFVFICQQIGISMSFADYCFIFPLGLLASVMPISVLGAGAREVALISLLVTHGEVSEVNAVSVSTAYLGCLWFLGLTGGLLHLTSGKLSATSVDGDTNQSSESTLPQD